MSPRLVLSICRPVTGTPSRRSLLMAPLALPSRPSGLGCSARGAASFVSGVFDPAGTPHGVVVALHPPRRRVGVFAIAHPTGVGPPTRSTTRHPTQGDVSGHRQVMALERAPGRRYFTHGRGSVARRPLHDTDHRPVQTETVAHVFDGATVVKLERVLRIYAVNPRYTHIW